MLELTSPRWSGLTQAHGRADDIPRLLEALASLRDERERDEIWFGLWATLCPDGRVHSAAYAAVPHLLDITASMSLGERAAALHLATEVELSRHEPNAPALPDDLVQSYAAAIDGLPARVAELMGNDWPAPVAQVIAAALLAGKRQPALARAVLDLARDVP